MNTKLIASALLLSLPLTLAACNKKPDDQPANSPATDTTATTAPVESTAVDPNVANVAQPDQVAPASDSATATADVPATTDSSAAHDTNHPTTTN